MWARSSLRAVRSRCLRFRDRHVLSSCSFSTSAPNQSYADTIKNLRVTLDTRVVVQGFTGKQATFDSKQSLEYGTKIVGGVRPGKEGEHLGLPYLPSMRAVKEQFNPHATLVYVAAPHAAGAIEEAIQAQIPLIVAVAEHIPLHDMLRVHAMLREQSKSRLVGANSPGMTSTHARCRLGFQPTPFFKQGVVSIAAKSGTLSYETVASTTKAGLGQSYVIGVGGDALPGTDFVDALEIFESDENTEGIILVGEVGGFAEERAADWIKDYHRRTAVPKPIMALIGGLQAVQGRVMGHDGAFIAPGEGDAQSKIRALESAGVVMTDHPAKFGMAMKNLISTRKNPLYPGFQKRNMHTLRRRRAGIGHRQFARCQRRTLILSATQGLEFLKAQDLPVAPSSSFPTNAFTLTFSVDRSFYIPQLHIQRLRAASTVGASTLISLGVAYKLGSDMQEYQETFGPMLIVLVGLDRQARDEMEQLLYSLLLLWRQKEGQYFRVEVGGTHEANKFVITSADLRFDDWAYRSSGRHADLHSLRDASLEVKEEVDAEADGIVYIRLPSPAIGPATNSTSTSTNDNDDSNSNGKFVGTLVNGAGLAMNATDALTGAGIPVANFLDTGGKATTATVRASLRAVTSDTRVGAVFVNIFGGLTRCDMIAEGIVEAVREQEQEQGEQRRRRVPLVVRLRGTCEAEGAELLRREFGDGGGGEGGVRVFVEQDFEQAVRRVGALVGVDVDM